jgi:hypothetical protein
MPASRSARRTGADQQRPGDFLRQFHNRRATLTLLCAALVLVSVRSAFAYRPFDATDAAVADRGAIEIECGPIGYIVEIGDRSIIVPAAILNVGLPNGWELVAEGKNFLRVGVGAPQSVRLQDSAISMKKVLREGSLQNRPGLSVAFEASLLLPTGGIGTQPGLGMTGIVSRRWSNAALHVNGAGILDQDGRWSPASGVILEGPGRWSIRPVGELTVDGAKDRTIGTLFGAIWQLDEHLALDTGWRMSNVNGTREREFRAGFTWEFSTRRAVSVPRGPEAAP